MKKVIVFIIGLLIILALSGLTVLIIYKNKQKENNNKDAYYHTIGFKELKKKIDNGDDIILVIHQTGCGHCANYLPIVKDVSNEYKIDIYNINTTDLSEDDKNAFNSIVHYSGTPTTIFYFAGVETTPLNRIIGETSKTNLVTRLKSLGLISDDENK